ncbi:sporulation protein YqfD [Ectobacillus sp. JY-23]|uniref:sporulation protein YqfD n=1 Tax=Ectobacillus sp. JY-23 TaxID=2933872 RepID=UPI001FF6074B|nr:sporulation protein YqfD [Ectobacillus sp. JY-23]UOY94051.1 sporulation protein YqfD [Ectobacillus sp. JY-23]
MKNQWMTFFFGHVKVRLAGRGVERFLNECVRKGMHVWDVRRVGEDMLTFRIYVKDVKALRPIFRKYECDLTFVERGGLPFLQKRTFRNAGFTLGLLGFFSILLLLSNMVWNVEIKGAKPDTAYIIEKELQKMGVTRGKLQFQVPNVEQIQWQLTNNVGSITWVGVELRGTTYHLQVVEKNEPEQEKVLPPQNLVARKKAIVQKMFVEHGKTMVQLYDHVEPGQLLVSGMYGPENQPTVTAAEGVVFGETWYDSVAEIPLKTSFQVYTGEFFHKHYLKIGNFKIKIWGFEKNKYKQYKEETITHPLHFLKWELPFGYEKVIVREEEGAIRQYSEKEALTVGVEMARGELKKKLESNAIILGEKVLQKQIENGTLKLKLYFKVIENIAVAQPITESNIQGD